MTFKCLPVSAHKAEIGSQCAYGVAQKPAEFIAQAEFMLFFFSPFLFSPPSPSLFPFSLPSLLPSLLWNERCFPPHHSQCCAGRDHLVSGADRIDRQAGLKGLCLGLDPASYHVNFKEIMKQVS